MTPNNMVPSRLRRPLQYTDGSTSREVENAWGDETPELKKFKDGFAHDKTSITQIRDKLNNIIDLLEVCRTSLLSDYYQVTKVSGVMYFHCIQDLEQIEKELSNL